MKTIMKKRQRLCLPRGTRCSALLALSWRMLAAAEERSSEEKPNTGEKLRLRPHLILGKVTIVCLDCSFPQAAETKDSGDSKNEGY